MLTLGRACTKAGGLTLLRSFTSTVCPNILAEAWVDAIELLVKGSRIEVFQSYIDTSSSDVTGVLADKLCVRVIHQHRDHLVRLCLDRQWIRLATVEHVCISCPRLEDLSVAIHPGYMVYSPFSFW